jgi:hypothetical protein
MDTLSLTQPSHSTAFLGRLSEVDLRQRVPSAVAHSAHEGRSASYTFISTARVVDALGSAGFYPVEARQALSARSPLHARHLIRFRRRFETVALRDAVPEILFLNSHDGTSAYQLRIGLYRAICTNGLVVSAGTFPVFGVAHVAMSSRTWSRGHSRSASDSRHSRRPSNAWSRRGSTLQRLDFAADALALRFRAGAASGVEPARLLVPRRAEDVGNDLLRTFNVVQLWGVPHN